MTITRRVLTTAAVLGIVLLSGCSDAHLPLDISTHGKEIDDLFWLITWIVGIAFIATEAILIYCIFKFRTRAGAKAQHTHGHHGLEMTWTIATAVILIVLAFYQLGAWRTAKMPDWNKLRASNPVEIQVLAKQFEWNFRYKDKDGNFTVCAPTGELWLPKDRNVIFELRSADVLHSLFLPNLRFKQDLVPGTRIYQWVQATKTTKERRQELGNDDFDFEIACAELCGYNHYQMRGKIKIVENDEFEAKIKQLSEFGCPDIWDRWDDSRSYTEAAMKARLEESKHHGTEEGGD